MVPDMEAPFIQQIDSLTYDSGSIVMSSFLEPPPSAEA